MKSTKTQKMYITLISVMKQINALEEYLYIKLVNRTHRGIKLTGTKKFMMKLKYLSKIQIII